MKFQSCSIVTCQVLTNTTLYYSNGFQFFPQDATDNDDNHVLFLLTLQSSTFISLGITNICERCLCLKKPNKNFHTCSAAPLRGIKKFTAGQNSSGPTFMCIVLLTRSSAGSRGNGVFPEQSRTFIEFSKFRKSDKLLKHELGSI